MKKLVFSTLALFLLGAFVFFNACKKQAATPDVVDEVETVVGTWKLVATFAGIGDGKLIHDPITSDQTVTFDSEGGFSVVSGELYCTNDQKSNFFREGKYSLEGEKIIFSEIGDCDNSFYYYRWDAGKLVLGFTNCIEGCGQVYERVK